MLPLQVQTVQYRFLRRSGRLYGNHKSPLSCRSSGSLQNIWKPGLKGLKSTEVHKLSSLGASSLVAQVAGVPARELARRLQIEDKVINILICLSANFDCFSGLLLTYT